MNTFVVGNTIRFSATFAVDGTVIDPSSVTAKVKQPGSPGTETSYVYGDDPEIEQDSTGRYHIDVDISLAGDWVVRWVAEGSAKGARELTVRARRSAFATP